MKRLFVITILLLGMLALNAQTPKEEAIQSLDNAKKLISEDQLAKAQDEINFALSKINEIQAEQLLKYIPEAPTGFKLENKDSQALGQAGAMFGSVNSVTATGNYTKSDTSIDVTITLGGILGQTGGLMGLASMFGGGKSSGGKSIRVGSYTGNQEFDKDDNSGTLTIQVGQRITVMITGSEIANADILKTFAEKIDLAKLEKSF